MPKLISGAEIVFKSLEDQNVEFIFGYPGGAVLPIYDELKNPAEDNYTFYTIEKLYLQRGLYYKYLFELLKWFPMQNIFIILFDIPTD